LAPRDPGGRRRRPGTVRLSVRVQPRAARDEIAGRYGDGIKIRLTAPPVDGAANEALVKFLARTLDIPANAITIVAGGSSRSKIVELAGVPEDRVRRLEQR
jgi:uncharacterized protein (TIGR00251 family)